MRLITSVGAVLLLSVCVFGSAWAGSLDPRLAALTAGGHAFVRATALGHALEPRTADPMLPRIRADGRVEVYVHPATLHESLPTVQELATVGCTDMEASDLLGVVQAWVPVGKLKALAALPGVGRVSVPSYAAPPGPVSRRPALEQRVHAAAAATLPLGLTIDHAAVVAMQADKLQAVGATGVGVKIGLISDGDAGLSASQAAGYTPASVWVVPNLQGSGSEGTAMLEEAHAMMPDASLGFCSPASTVDFLTCYADLANWGANMIADDLGYYDTDAFTVGKQNPGSFADAVSQFTTAHPKMAFLTSAGNDGKDYFQAAYTPGPGTTIGGISYPSLMDFGKAVGGSSDTRVTIHVDAGESIHSILQWNDPVNTIPDVLVLYLLDGNGAVLAKSGVFQAPDGRIGAHLDYIASTSGDDYLEVACQSCANPITIKLNGRGNGALDFDIRTAGSVAYGHKVADNMQSLAAAGVVDESPLTVNREAYSNAGPFLYGDFGATSTLDKPDMTGIDAVLVSGAGNFGRPVSTGGALFCGTSATGANVGALIAALMQAMPGQDASYYYNILQSTANQTVFVASPTSGPCEPSTSGYSTIVAGAGLAQGYAALASVYAFPAVSITAPVKVADGQTGSATVPVGVAVTYKAAVQGGTNTASAADCHWTENAASPQTGASAVYTVTAVGAAQIDVNCADGHGIESPTPPKLTVNAENIAAPTVADSHLNGKGFDLTLTGYEPLTVTAGSSNQALLPDSGITISSGCGVSTLTCSVTLKPVANAHGSTTVTVTATDPWGQKGIQAVKVTYSASVGGGGFGWLSLATLCFVLALSLLAAMHPRRHKK